MPALKPTWAFLVPLYGPVKQVKYTQRVPESHMDILDHGKGRGCLSVPHLFCKWSQKHIWHSKIPLASYKYIWFSVNITNPLSFICK